jgi:hypothetical protein
MVFVGGLADWFVDWSFGRLAGWWVGRLVGCSACLLLRVPGVPGESRVGLVFVVLLLFWFSFVLLAPFCV